MVATLPLGAYVQGALTSPDQEIDYDFNGTEGVEYVIVVQGADSGKGTLADPFADLWTTLWGDRLHWLTDDDDSGPGRDALIYWTAGLDEVLRVVVSSATSSQTGTFTVWYGPAASYQLGATPAADLVVGTTGNDLIDGMDGADTMKGGLGNDTYILSQVGDVVVEKAAAGEDTILSEMSLTLGANVENLQLLGTADHDGNGNGLGNRLLGNAGNNTLRGMGGIDTMEGGAGNDTYYVDAGNEVVIDSSGVDRVFSSATFALVAGLENLTLTGSGDTNATGNAGHNRLTGNSGANLLTGGGGHDTLVGGGGLDSFNGGAGNDTYLLALESVGPAALLLEPIIDSSGIDLVISPASIDLSAWAAIENITLTGRTNLHAFGNSGHNTLTGNFGANLLVGGEGNDRLVGNAGIDTLNGGLGNDTYVINASASDKAPVDSIIDAGGTDGVESAVGVSIASLPDLENITLTGSATVNATGNAADNTLTGNGAANRLKGGGGNDTLSGMGGVDTLEGGVGNDTYLIGSGDVDQATHHLLDMIVEAGGIDTILATTTIDITGLAGIERLTLAGTGNLGATGNSLPNLVTGTAGDNALAGGDGNDTLVGGAGLDTLEGGNGRDTFDFNTIDELWDGVNFADTINDFTRGDDLIDLSTIDANTTLAGLQDFTFVEGNNFTGEAGQLLFRYGSAQADLDGDTQVDLSLRVYFSNLEYTLSAADFLL